MGTLDYLLNKYKIPTEQTGMIKIHCSKFGTIPRLFRELKFTLGVEVGVEIGVFSKALCAHNIGLKLYSVDSWEVYSGYKDDHYQKHFDKMYIEAKERLRPYNSHIVKDYSINAVKRFEDESLDFVYLDANHDYEFIKEDLREWSKKVRKGGIVSGHDWVNGCNGQSFGVKQAVNEYVEDNDVSHLFILNKVGCPSWMMVK